MSSCARKPNPWAKYSGPNAIRIHAGFCGETNPPFLPLPLQNRAMSLSSPFQLVIIPDICGSTPKTPSQPCP